MPLSNAQWQTFAMQGMQLKVGESKEVVGHTALYFI
jgi:hypothetical protein